MSNPWFRLYSKITTDPVIEFLSFEDQRHFVWILCMKNDGVLDKKYIDKGMLDRVVARRLGLSGEAFDNTKERLLKTKLINKKWQPKKWKVLQYESDSSTQRTRKYRAKKGTAVTSCDVTGDVTVTPPDTDTDTDTDKEHNAKAVMDLFNNITGRSFKNVNKNLAPIRARIREGYNLEDFQKVIKAKNAEWCNDPVTKTWVRPETVFGTKFESYLQAAAKPNRSSVKSNRPEYKEVEPTNTLTPEERAASIRKMNEVMGTLFKGAKP